ncbi:PREDICTED: translocon-associated protein subunit beta-like [Tarenaya hassleriana]|uniref:translocon-associated protein subunit beta-like n=1 Tax=Tarenaya hassleriana TaxID=28532 RepID=UPI00053C7992|nr:PREDICTED: translocon-associated protein subunit beta-like [Tarenaya hassleriana]
MAIHMTRSSSTFALVFMVLFSASLASSEVPFMVVHKKASLSPFKSGSERVSVTIDIYNQGSSTAYDVSVADDGWNSDIFDIVSGNTSMSWEKLDVGDVLSHSFELEAKTKGLFYGSPAVVTFRVPSKGVLQAYSTPILPLDVLAERVPEQKFEWAKRLAAKYGSHVSVISLVVAFAYLIASPSKASKKKR